MYKILGGLVLLLVLPFAMAGEPAVFATDEGAIRGYDPVAYFKVGTAIRGSNQFTAEWQDATFHFANADNQAAFKGDPAAYARNIQLEPYTYPGTQERTGAHSLIVTGAEYQR